MALALAVVLGLGWTLRAWSDLASLRLPDGDDLMRLQQVRDWLAGQPWSDVSQHRLGTGLPMHWSRLADLAPAGVIATLAPLVERHAAEVTAVIVCPLASFAVALLLIARIARHLGGAALARTAAIVAAVAYPATTIFLPGRIDHHGLQLVLLLGGVLALAGEARLARGCVAGIACAVSLVVGMETVLPLGALAAIALADWVMERPGAVRQLAGFGGAALLALVAARWLFATTAWHYPACDGFTDEAWRGATTLTAAPLILAAVRASGARLRIIAVLVVGGLAVTAALLLSPSCLAPYGAVDPLLARLWLANVEEAQPLLRAGPAQAFGYGGVMIAGTAATGWRLWWTRERGWALLLAVQLAALVTTLLQLRGAYAGAMLGAPGLASVVVAARARGTLALIGAWIASAGMLYPIAAEAVTASAAPAGRHRGGCAPPALVNSLATLRSGTVMAPIDAGPSIIAATQHRVVAAPYHRNNAGNRAMFTFFIGDPTTARLEARRWRVDYVVFCDGDFDAFSPAPEALVGQLQAGTPPSWLKPLPTRPAGPRLYAVRP